ncbi:hypothetical protein CK203_033111 [Vitis vinifera]|uniref:Uncharacterized protein n=1 Tax=Vitis vinifera TaxID=29760 RepID=A0A438G0E7_VITVI|nr:hypothetical protein CK203_033111 [Vitis vinifera]
MVRKKFNEEARRKSDEVRGDVVSPLEQRVEEERVSARLKTLNLLAEVRGAQVGPIVGPKEARRAGGLVLANGSLGLKLKGVATREDGTEAGPSSRRWAVEMVAMPQAKVQSRQKLKPPAKAQSRQWATKTEWI